MNGIVGRARTDRLATGWMVGAVVILAAGLIVRRIVPVPLWTMVHVVALGVLVNGIMQWTWFFARALLHLPPDDRRATGNNVIRNIAFNAILVALFAAMWTGSAWAAATGAGLIGAVIAWHGLDLVLAARGALSSRFAIVIRYYIAASGFLVLGCILAGFVAVGLLSGHPAGWLAQARDGLTLAHAISNVAGWVGLSMAGTLVTLGPTMLRTRLDPLAVARARRGLPWMSGGLLLAVVAACCGLPIGIGGGLLVFATALTLDILLPLVRAGLTRAPRSVAPWTLTAGVAWTLCSLGAVIVHAFGAADATALRAADLTWLPLLGGGGLAQVFVAALTYLMPVVIGGGPAAMREGMGVLERAWPVRVGARNTALLLLAWTAASGAGPRALWWAVVLAGYGADIVLFALSGMRQARFRHAAGTGSRIETDHE